MKRTTWLLLLAALIVVGGAGYLGYQNSTAVINTTAVPPKPITVAATTGLVQRTVTAPGQLVGTREQVLGVDVGGRLLALNVRPGTIVQAGDILAQVDPAPYEKALAAAETELAMARLAWERELAAAELAIAGSEASVNSTRAQVPALTEAELRLQAAVEAEARAAYEYQKAQDRPWEPPEVLAAYRLEYEAAQRQTAIAQAQVDAIRNQQWAVSQQVASLETTVDQAQVTADYLRAAGLDPRLEQAVAAARADLAATTLVAPYDGVILDVFARSGEYAPAGAELMLLADPGQGEVRTTVIEEDLSLVAIGQPVELFFDARPDVVVAGVVSRLVPRRVIGEARPLYHVYIQPTDPLPAGVVPGMTADAAIIIDQVDEVIRLPRALVAARSDGTAVVRVWTDGAEKEQTITVGLRGDVYTEVLAGLAAGAEVVGE